MHWLITSPLGETMNISPETYKSLKVKFEFMDLHVSWIKKRDIKNFCKSIWRKIKCFYKTTLQKLEIIKNHMLQSIFS